VDLDTDLDVGGTMSEEGSSLLLLSLSPRCCVPNRDFGLSQIGEASSSVSLKFAMSKALSTALALLFIHSLARCAPSVVLDFACGEFPGLPLSFSMPTADSITFMISW
jgi:hypothetical protein